jgi:transcriptional regulator with XRE-family HTH domain
MHQLSIRCRIIGNEITVPVMFHQVRAGSGRDDETFRASLWRQRPLDRTMSRRRRPGRLSDLSSTLPPARMALAVELRLGRDSSNLSLAALARHTYSSKATVSRWLNGRGLPSQEQAKRWAELCGTDRDVMNRLWTAAAEPKHDVHRLHRPASEGPDGHSGQRIGPNKSAAAGEVMEPTSGEPSEAARPGLRRKGSLIAAIAGVIVVLGAGALILHLHEGQTCHFAYPVILHIPAETGTSVGITAEAACNLDPNRTYLVVEKIPDVDPANPHPAWYIKAQLPHLAANQTNSQDFDIKEPVGTEAEFYVISVDNGGLQALGQNQVVDNGILQLPSGTRQESIISWHVKGWQLP